MTLGYLCEGFLEIKMELKSCIILSWSERDKPVIKERNFQIDFEGKVRQLFDYSLKSNDPRHSIILHISSFAFLKIIISILHMHKSNI
jgi:hypothetical protein